ncbi:MAG: carboxylesterase family protein [Clostridiales bacterium]|nr:carboxylesterase family protein [Clostridiales bacterium]
MKKLFYIRVAYAFVMIAITFYLLPSIAFAANDVHTEMQALYGENAEIDGSYDKRLAAKCYNGIFVGKERNGVIAYKGIPYAEQPVKGLRWKSPVSAQADDRVYEAYYFGCCNQRFPKETLIKSPHS